MKQTTRSQAQQTASAYEVVSSIAQVFADVPTVSRHGKRGPHAWVTFGCDEMYERCDGCGAVRKVSVKQGGLF